MNEKPLLRWLGLFVFVVIVSLLVSPATLILTLGVLGNQAQHIIESSDGDAVVIIGVGNSGNVVGRGSRDGHRGLARTLTDLEATAPITDEMLQQTYEVIWQRARQGDVAAAGVIAHIAELQRQSAPPEAE